MGAAQLCPGGSLPTDSVILRLCLTPSLATESRSSYDKTGTGSPVILCTSSLAIAERAPAKSANEVITDLGAELSALGPPPSASRSASVSARFRDATWPVAWAQRHGDPAGPGGQLRLYWQLASPPDFFSVLLDLNQIPRYDWRPSFHSVSAIAHAHAPKKFPGCRFPYPHPSYA
jgi:hypothetical protein